MDRHGLAAGAFALVCAVEPEPVAGTCPDPRVIESIRHTLDLARRALTGRAMPRNAGRSGH